MKITTKPVLEDKLSQVDNEATPVASLSMESITTFPISQLGKYVVTCEIGELTEIDFQKVQRLAQSLDQWWRSDNKFFVLVENDNVPKIRFERIESEDSNELQ